MKSIRGPTIILPKYLQGTDPESKIFAEAYFLVELHKWAEQYKNKVVRNRARYYKKNMEAKDAGVE